MAKRYEILLVEDDPADVDLIVELFKSNAPVSAVYVVSDGEEALLYLRRQGKYAEHERPDLILLDLNIPKINGFEVLAEIRTDDDLRLLPVLVLTTSGQDRDAQLCYGLGANAYLVKPANTQQFARLLQLLQEFWLGFVKCAPKYAGRTATHVLEDFLRERSRRAG